MAVIRKEAYYSSANGRNMIRTLIWQDDSVAPVAVLQIAHGVVEHIGRYDEFASYLTQFGFVVCGNDHIGHGKSVNDETELGYIDENDGYVYMVRDMNTLYKIMHKRYADLPYFLFGHSLGSFLAKIYAENFGHELAGLVLCGTGLLPAVASMFDGAIDDVFSRLNARGTQMNFFNTLTGKVSSRMYGEDDPLSWLSANAENRENYRNDPLCGFDLQNGGTKNVAVIGMKGSDPKWAEKLCPELPIMLISGAKDPIGMNGKGVLDLSDQLVNAGFDPVVILYPTDRHEILQEDDRDRVFEDVRKFLSASLQGVSFYDI
ncbi:MAG: alpha/beta hydrolase [Clostridia bacterium]|nr:alpha/beta hydrolase [Clostridia bacterium]